jgi:trehalose 6-phosphate phosphatase
VVNLVPVGGPHKGMSLLELMAKSKTKCAFYIGDDDTDEDIFSLAEAGLFTVRVGKKSSSQAKFFIRNQAEVKLLLEILLKFLNPAADNREPRLESKRY